MLLWKPTLPLNSHHIFCNLNPSSNPNLFRPRIRRSGDATTSVGPAAVMFFVSVLAETNRVPFDLTEGESELVSGFNVEYSSMSFALFFLAEYCHIILMSTFGVLLFLGGWLLPFNIFGITPSFYNFVWFAIKIVIIVFLFIWIRATYPRIRYDQLMTLLWKSYLPLSGGFVILVSGILIGESAFPSA